MSEVARFTVAIPESMHRDLRMIAATQNVTVNDLAKQAFELLLQQKSGEVERHVEAWLRGRQGKGLWEVDDPEPTGKSVPTVSEVSDSLQSPQPAKKKRK